MFSTLDVSKLSKFKLVSSLHPSNISDIFVTFEVLNPLTSNSVTLEQEINISAIFVALTVLKPLTSKALNLTHPPNISEKFVT